MVRCYRKELCIEMFFKDTEWHFGLGNCDLQDNKDDSRYGHLLMATYSLVFLNSYIL